MKSPLLNFGIKKMEKIDLQKLRRKNMSLPAGTLFKRAKKGLN